MKTIVTLAVVFLVLIVACGGAIAATTFYATTAVSAGDVVVWDPTADYGVKTTAVEGAQAVAGVADESVTAGNLCIIRQDGGRVAVNVVGTVTRGQWLITSATAGKAKGVDSPQAGIFARAVTAAGVPAPGQCYASIELGFDEYFTGSSGSGAPVGATYITQTHDAALSAEQALADLESGLLKNTTATGVLSIAAAGTDYSAPGHQHTEADITDLAHTQIDAENNEQPALASIGSINVNGEDLKFIGAGGDRVNLELGTTCGELSGGTRTISVNGAIGNDANPGTSAAPFATIQRAWDAVPAVVLEPIVIDIAAGTYPEALLFAGKTMGSAGASVTLQGALVNSDAGTATGATATTLSDTSKSWGTNAHQYKLLRITAGTGSGQLAWIASNTATSITIAGQWTTVPNATSAYSIDSLGTSVNGGAGNISIRLDEQRGVTLRFLQCTAAAQFVVLDNSSAASLIGLRAATTNVTSRAFEIKSLSVLKGTGDSAGSSEAIFADDVGNIGLILRQLAAGTLSRSYFRSCGSVGVQVTEGAIVNIYNSYTYANTNYGIFCNRNATLMTAGGAYASYINSETVGIRNTDASLGVSVSTQNYFGCGTAYSADASSTQT